MKQQILIQSLERDWGSLLEWREWHTLQKETEIPEIVTDLCDFMGVTPATLSEWTWLCECANALAKTSSEAFYDAKDWILARILGDYPEACAIDSSWGMYCVHVHTPHYGITCFHTMMYLPVMDELRRGEWNGMRRQFASLTWGMLSADVQAIVVDASYGSYAAEQTLINLRDVEGLEGLQDIAFDWESEDYEESDDQDPESSWDDVYTPNIMFANHLWVRPEIDVLGDTLWGGDAPCMYIQK